MTNLLAIDSSITGASSVSRTLVDHFVSEYAQHNPDAAIVRRDVGAEPIPHLLPETMAGVRATAESDLEKTTRDLSDELIGELRQADTIVLGVPMYNFSVPTGLRTWYDHIARPGETFSYSEAGPKGLLEGKRVIVIESRGGLYSEGPAQPMDHQEPYLRTLFGFIGLTDVTFIHAEKIGFGPEARDAAISSAKMQLSALVRDGSVAAAEPELLDS